jgi:phosphoglycolate phosphatase
MMRPAALVFDLDGTLIDSRRDITAAVNRTRGELGLPPLALEQVVTMVGEGARRLIERAVPERLQDVDRILERYLGHYREVCLETTRPYPGIAEMLQALADRYPLALLSNKGEALSRRILDGLGLARFFREILGGDSLATRKPDPAGLRLLAERLKTPVARLLLIGDTWIDAETARNAGCAFALVEWGFSSPEKLEGVKAELRAATAEELAAALVTLQPNGGLPQKSTSSPSSSGL